MTFSEDAWIHVAPWGGAIVGHPFLRTLSDGSLARDVFARYLLDDAHYLVGYARVLATLAARAPTSRGVSMLAASAASAIEAERSLHRGYLLPLGIDPDSIASAEASPTCQGYLSWLHTVAVGPPHEVGVAAVLPCFRVYAEVGKAIVATGPGPDHPYRAWIDTYADPAFDDAVRAAEAYTDELADAASEPVRREMLEAYAHASRFEWMFWDAAWRGEAWPTPR